MKIRQQIQAILAGNDVHRDRVEPIADQIMKALGGNMPTDKQLIQQIVADYFGAKRAQRDFASDTLYGRCLVCDAPATEDQLCGLHQSNVKAEQWRQACESFVDYLGDSRDLPCV